MATGCCTELRVKMLLSLLLVLTRLQLPLAGVGVAPPGVLLAGASLDMRRAGGGVLKLSAAAPAAAGLLRLSVLDLRSEAAALLAAEGLSMLLLRPKAALLLAFCVSWRRRTSPLRLSAAGPDTCSRSLQLLQQSSRADAVHSSLSPREATHTAMNIHQMMHN
jgi:hypothetical protein